MRSINNPPGTDVNGQMILIGQGINTGLFSEQADRSARMSSFVEDPTPLNVITQEIEGYPSRIAHLTGECGDTGPTES